MLSRATLLPRFSSLARQLNTSQKFLMKQTILLNNEAPEIKTELSKKLDPSDSSTKISEFEKKILSKYSTHLKNKHNIGSINPNTNENSDPNTNESQISQNEQNVFNDIIEKCNKDLNSPENLLNHCKELIIFSQSNSKLSKGFLTSPLKPKITEKLLPLLDSNTVKDKVVILIVDYMIRFNLKDFALVENKLVDLFTRLNVENLLTLKQLFSNVRINAQIHSNLKMSIREKIDELKSIDSIMQAMKIFSSDTFLLNNLDEKVLQSSDNLTTQNWIDLLNIKSKIKHRNVKIIEACIYNINTKKIDISSIQQCLLSCGVLNYRDDQFFKYLIQRFKDLLEDSKSNKEFSLIEKRNFFSITTSIGMLNLRDKSLLNSLCEFFMDKNDPRLLSNFVISCGSLNYTPKKIDQLVSKLKIDDFNDLNSGRGKMFFLNYVWSLCMLKCSNVDFISEVLKESFWKESINDGNIYLKPFIIKLLNVNLYAQIFYDDYKGPLLPDEINAANFTQTLKSETSSIQNSFISTLSSYRVAEKYFKSNLLTPYGIVIDAVMVINEKGKPCVITEYLNQNGQLETKNDKEKKIAFKLVDYKDTIPIGNKLSGNLSMQLLLLKELGYVPITVTQYELQNSTVIQRVNLISKKLEKAAHEKNDYNAREKN